MSSLAEAGMKAATRSRLLWLALALSLTLNVFFVAGLVWSQAAEPRIPPPAERLARAASELNLSPDQRQAFEQFVQAVRQRTEQLRDSNQPLIQRVWDELATAHPDR